VPILCIATAKACAVITAPFTEGLGKINGDFFATVLAASVIKRAAKAERRR
jgi:hypothetical protein